MSPDTAQSAGVKAVITSTPRWLARWLLGTAEASVAYLKFGLAGGKALRARAVPVSGQPFLVVALPPGQSIVSRAAYDKAGHKLDGGTGTPKIDTYTGPLSASGWAGINCALSDEKLPECHHII